jgi:DNA-binding winged helix-turn-helix (wHTH) protein
VSEQTYRFGEYEADVRAAELRRKGTRLKLQMQPFQVLVVLLERPNEVVTREELRRRLWPEDTFVDFDHSLNTAIAKLREALGDSASEPRYIETIAKRGYRFLVMPSRSEQEQPRSETVSKTEAAAMTSASPLSSEIPQTPDHLPRASRATSRTLFILAQVLYLVFYLSALFSLSNLQRSTQMAWRSAGFAAFIIYLVTALAGVPIRLYLIAATSLDYHLLAQKYRMILPALFPLDLIWALSPLLLADRMGMGLALGATAALLYLPFAQRTLMQMINRRLL